MIVDRFREWYHVFEIMRIEVKGIKLKWWQLLIIVTVKSLIIAGTVIVIYILK